MIRPKSLFRLVGFALIAIGALVLGYALFSPSATAQGGGGGNGGQQLPYSAVPWYGTPINLEVVGAIMALVGFVLCTMKIGK